MSAYRATARSPEIEDGGARPLGLDERPALTRLLAERAAATPDADAFGRAPGWSCRWALAEVDRVAARLQDLGLPDGSPVGVIMPSGPLASVVLLALEGAHLLPCLIPAHLSEEGIEAALALVNAQAVVVTAVYGDLRPADLACAIAARRFGLRFVLAFGPGLPDGVIDLRPGAGESLAPRRRPAPTRSGIVTLDSSSTRVARSFHVTASLIETAAAIVAAADIRSGDTIVSGLAIDDLKGVCAGPVAALLAGASLDTSLVARPEMLAGLAADPRHHLVLPSWAAHLVAVLPNPDGFASLVAVVDEARVQDVPGSATVELWCCGESSVEVSRRPTPARPAGGTPAGRDDSDHGIGVETA